MADNVLSFGQPLDEYLQHVRNDGLYGHSELHKCYLEYSTYKSFENHENHENNENHGKVEICFDEINIQGGLKEVEKEEVDGLEISVYR